MSVLVPRFVLCFVLATLGGCYLSHQIEDGPDASPPVVEDLEAQWFVYRRRRVTVGGEYEFYAIRLGDLRVLSLGRSASDEAFAWSPTIAGRFARLRAPLGGETRVEVGQLQPDRAESLADFPGGLPLSGSADLEWSGDGEWLRYALGSGTPAVYSNADRSGEPIVMSREPCVWVDGLPWLSWPGVRETPLGREDAFFVARAEDRFEPRALQAPYPGRFSPIWANAGRWATVVDSPTAAGRRQLWVAAGPEASPVHVWAVDGIVASGDVRWSPSGRHLWVQGVDEGALVSHEGDLVPVELGGSFGGWVSDDGFIVHRTDGVYLLDVAGDAVSEAQILDEPCDEVTSTETSTLWLILACENAERTMRHHFAWTESTGAVAVPQLDTGRGFRDRYPELIWSPNGERVLTMDHRTLRELRTLDGELRLVSDSASWAEWSSDSSAYVYSTNPGGVAVVDVESGEEIEIEAPDDDYLVSSEGVQRID